jgi:hypothetical protein
MYDTELMQIPARPSLTGDDAICTCLVPLAAEGRQVRCPQCGAVAPADHPLQLKVDAE